MNTIETMARRQKKKQNKISMKNKILALLFSRVGPLVKAVVSSTLGFVVTWAAGKGIKIGADLQIQIASSLSGLIWLLIDHLANKYLGDRVEVIQQAYGLKTDRFLGDKTTGAAIDPNNIPRPTEIL
jgi:hypothetical protein